MCVNIGHGDERVIRAIQQQAETLAYANPFMATEARARLGRKLAEICPGDIEVFFFTNGGAEANENAIKIARFYTGRHKILSFYRSYHGGTAGAMTLTGDPRRWAAEPGTEEERRATFALVDAAFQQRRKMLRQALSGVLGGSAASAAQALERAGIDPQARGEQLRVDDFLAIARASQPSLA
jgi:4-aminobutyrate aminotransferase-like enzyme